jgi:CheY-like chemotaxis protein/DNA-directed RNA polymerase specialized sigma24 family protein
MTLSNTIVQHLPYLRRYARALAGSQRAGDCYVAATLEALVEDPALLSIPAGPRVGLYRAFTRIWNSVRLNAGAAANNCLAAPDQRLAAITPLPRQAFLLVALEEFSENDAAQILNIEVETLRMLVDESGREIAFEVATDVLIIEDEALIALELQELVEGLGHTTVGIASTHAEAIALAKNKQPGLILADVRLADGSSGLDAVNELLQSTKAPVVFITAFPQQFLTGNRPEPAFLINKPFQRATVSAVISQALFFQDGGKPPASAVKVAGAVSPEQSPTLHPDF